MEMSSLPESAERFLNHLQVERGLSPNSLLAYRSDLQKFFDSESFLDEDSFSRFLKKLHQSNLSVASITRIISSLRSSLETVISLVESCQDDVAGIRDRAILELFYSAGIRVSEAVGLNLVDFRGNEETSTSRFVRVIGKGSKERLVPVGAYAVVAMENYLVRARPHLSKDRSNPALFLNHHGRRLTRQGIWHLLKEASKRAGLSETVSPHQLRHSFATHLLQNGADVRSVQELLGHASVTTTQIYTMVTGDALREVFTESHPRAR
ncbi:MAG: tyrosine recombinase XerD [Actinobacteria bacterium]|nr:tyrosine recombinase XerD [Actinomycetota bacterium]